MFLTSNLLRRFVGGAVATGIVLGAWCVRSSQGEVPTALFANESAIGVDELPPLPDTEMFAASEDEAFDQGPALNQLPSPEEWEAVLKRLETLEREQAKKTIAPVPLDEKTPKSWFEKSKENWKVKLGGHIQGDYVTWATASPSIVGDQNYFEFRRLRMMADGEGYGVFDFRIQIDIEPESGLDEGASGPFAAIKDAYLTMHDLPFASMIRFGNFFVPFGLEQVTNDTNNIFFERSIPTQGVFTADREVGVALYDHSASENLTWTFGFFFDNVSEATKQRMDDNQGWKLSGRLTWLPYYDEPSDGRYLIHTGIGALHTETQDGQARFRTRPQIHEGPFLIDSGILDSNRFTSANLELATVWGPISLQSEWYLTGVDLNSGESPLLYGGYLYGSYFLTGEHRTYDRFGQHGAQFGRPHLRENFFLVPGCHGTGAWEAKARMSYLDLTEVDSGRYHDLTVGFNWYWSDRIRVMFDWIHPITSSQTVFGKTTSNILGTRLDVNF